MCITVFCSACLIVGYIVVVPPFLQSQYGLSQGQAAMVIVIFSLLFSLVAACYTYFIPYAGANYPDYQLYSIGYGLAAIGICLLNFAVFHYMFFVVSVFVMGLGGGLVFPAYRTIAAALEPPAYQGKLHAALGSVSLLGAVAGSLGFGALVKVSGLGSDKCRTGKALSAFSGWPFLCLALNTVIGAISAKILLQIRLSVEKMPSYATSSQVEATRPSASSSQVAPAPSDDSDEVTPRAASNKPPHPSKSVFKQSERNETVTLNRVGLPPTR